MFEEQFFIAVSSFLVFITALTQKKKSDKVFILIFLIEFSEVTDFNWKVCYCRLFVTFMISA